MAVPNTERGRWSEEHGFSFIEMMVIVLILGVLIAIASGVFLLSQDKAKDAAAKTLATHGLETQKTFLAEKLRYGSAPEVAPLEPALEFADLPAGPVVPGAIVKGKVYVRDATGTSVELVAKSDSGACFWMREVDGETRYAKWNCDSAPPLVEYDSSW